ncbi:MAG: hypothetical protein ACYS1A_17355 [Planctomycetota bacterium]|jgi:hypothetical protein
MYKYIISITICLIPLQLILAEPVSVSKLLEEYCETQSKIQSFIIKSKDSSTNDSSFGNGEKEISYFSSELCFDGDRISFRNHLWGGFAMGRDIIPEDKAQYQSFLWDGKDYFQYSKSPTSTAMPHGIVKIDRSRKYAEKLICRGYNGAALLGFSFGDDEKIDTVLRKADIINVENELEPVGGSLCYVINATTPYGKYKVWIDPEHGYNIARMKVQKDTGDLMLGRSLSGKAKFSGFVENIRFAKVDDVWVPVEANIKTDRTYRNGTFNRSDRHHKRTEVNINPDFESLGFFAPDDIENGAEVLVLDVAGISYTWQDGKLISNIDEYVISQLDTMANEIMREKAGTQEPGVDEVVIDELDKETAKIMADTKDGTSTGPSVMTVSDLLEKYRAGQNHLKSFIAKAETTIERNSLSAGVEKRHCEFRTDGERLYHHSFLPPDQAGYKSFLWDGKSLIEYIRAGEAKNSRVSIREYDLGKNEKIAPEYRGAALMGICRGDYERVDFILAVADKISLRDKTDKIDESECYVIDAVTKRGKYTVWIDPKHGYNIAKMETQKGVCTTGSYFSLRNVRFEQIDGVWVPMKADIEQIKTTNGKTSTTKWYHERTEMILNPNHDTLGSFVADDIPEGTKVSIAGDQCKYKWQNGQPVAEVDSNVKP